MINLNTILYTNKPNFIGNAIVIGITSDSKYQIQTDYGNKPRPLTYKEIKNLGLLKVEDLNASFHKRIVEGVPVPYQKDKENRTFTVKLIDFDNPSANPHHSQIVLPAFCV